MSTEVWMLSVQVESEKKKSERLQRVFLMWQCGQIVFISCSDTDLTSAAHTHTACVQYGALTTHSHMYIVSWVLQGPMTRPFPRSYTVQRIQSLSSRQQNLFCFM